MISDLYRRYKNSIIPYSGFTLIARNKKNNGTDLYLDCSSLTFQFPAVPGIFFSLDVEMEFFL